MSLGKLIIHKLIPYILAIVYFFIIGVTCISLTKAESIITTKHNLSESGPGTIKATTESRICIFCHTPHRASAQPPLWNREDTRDDYILYDSPTLIATLGQPTGSSRLCLSCHDGTLALGNTISEPAPIQFQGGIIYLPQGHSMLETDLSDDHPISFVYDNDLALANQELVLPSSLPSQLPLDHNSMMQCSSCHDAHSNDFSNFLRLSPLNSQLCVGCHNKNGWTGSVHDIAINTWNGIGIDPWPHADGNTVAENGCMNCHQAHEAGESVHLLNYNQEENNCLVCHDGNIGLDISSTISLLSNHPVSDYTDVHQADEDPLTMPRHVECSDCHNPHAATTDDPAPPALNGALQMVNGIDINGNLINPVNLSYEICFKCHGDNHGATSIVTRVVNDLSTRQDFNPSSISFHPVASVGNNPDVPSLIPPLNESSIILCEDCHSTPSGSTAGPHGSDFQPILRLNYSTTDFTQESPEAYALCYSCHDRTSFQTNQSFKHHKKHIFNEDA
ncbi:MAG: cytochrome c3 family protein, partial [Candidatus Zixiibacteriota bacterium]